MQTLDYLSLFYTILSIGPVQAGKSKVMRTILKYDSVSIFVSHVFWLQMVLERYFELSGQGIELVLPKQLELQEKLRIGPPRDLDF